MAISVLIGGVDVTAAYKGGSLEITQRTGADQSGFKLRLENPDDEPTEEAEIVIYEDDAQTVKAARGRIRRPNREALVGDDGQGDEVFAFNLECVGWVRDIERRPAYSATHTAKTTGFCARDVVARVPGFSAAGITLGGRVLAVFESRREKLTRTLDRLAKIEGVQWWVDEDKVVHFDAIGSSPAPFALTDATWREIVALEGGKPSLRVEPDTTGIVNHGTMSYKGKYTGGSVNVFAASNQITGNGTAWLSRVAPGAKFRLNSSPKEVYTVEAVLSDTTIRLSSNFANVTGTQAAQAYTIDEIDRGTQYVSLDSVEAMAAITGDDGIFAATITAPPGSMTYEEAKDWLTAEVRSLGNVPVNIGFKSDSRKIPGKVAAGQTVTIQLSRWKVDTYLQIRQVIKRDTGAVDDEGLPIWTYDLRFEALLYDLASQLRRREEEAIEASASDAGHLDEVLGVTERVRITETARIGAHLSVREAVTVADSVGIEAAPFWAPFVWGPSVKSFDTQAEWLAGTLAGPTVSVGGTLSGIGTWLSPWMIQYSPNVVKVATLIATLPAGSQAVVEWRSANYGQTVVSAWFADLASVPDGKYLQARITLSSSGAAPSVDKLSFTPNKSPLRWSRSQWGGADTFDSQAEWSTWSLTNVDAAAVPGSLRLTVGQNAGTALSPWLKNRSRTVAKVVAETKVTPGTSAILLEYRTSLDGTDANASPWATDIKATPDNPFMQYRATLTGNATDRPELQKLVVKPN
jgi:hypothetical protein